MKTIGILGGLGPQATMDFEQKLHKVAQDLIPQHDNQGYPKIVTYFFRQPPMEVDSDGKALMPLVVNQELLMAAKELSGICDFLTIPSNTPHFFIQEIKKAFGKEVLDMAELAVQAVKERKLVKVGVLSIGLTLKEKLYQNKLDELGIAWVTIPEEDSEKLDKYIFDYMEGKFTQDAQDFSVKLVEALTEQGAESIILGCSEIPLLLKNGPTISHLINPAQLLAEAAIKYAIV
jgi:aspartate racemase